MATVLLLILLMSPVGAQAASPASCHHISAGRAAFTQGMLSHRGELMVTIRSLDAAAAEETLECVKALFERQRFVFLRSRSMYPLEFRGGRWQTTIEVMFRKFYDE